MFVFVMPPTLSACMGMCNCSDTPAKWEGIVDFDIAPSYDEDAGVWFYPSDPAVDCGARMTRGSNVITYDLTTTGCTKTGGGPLVFGSCRFMGYEPGDIYEGGTGRGELIFLLDADDESYLGGLDFQFDVVCGDRTEHQSQESFATQMCAD